MPYASEPGFYDGKFVKRGGHYAGDTKDVPAEIDQVETGRPGDDSSDGRADQTGQPSTSKGKAAPKVGPVRPEPKDETKPEPKKPDPKA